METWQGDLFWRAFNEPDNARGELILKAIVEFLCAVLSNERQKGNLGLVQK